MLNFFCVGKPPGKLVLVDAPGYGRRGRLEWGELFEHYVDSRTQYVGEPALGLCSVIESCSVGCAEFTC